jgi:Na+/melibiose symporter-like transporter
MVQPRELHGKRLLGYTIGNLGLLLPRTFEGVFIFQFYVYTVNLNSLLVSFGYSIQLIVGAIFGIIFGVIVDNKKPGKYGKRRPFLLVGLPIWVITTILIWFPPNSPIDNSFYLPTASYFWVIYIIRAITHALIYTVYTSMLPEQSQTFKNREKLASFSSFFQIIASIIALLLPVIVQSALPDPESVKWWNTSGEIIQFFIPLIGILFAIFGSITTLLVFLSVDESFYNTNQIIQFEKKKVTDAFRGLSNSLKDKNYLKLILAAFFIAANARIVGLLVFPFQTYVLQFQAAQFYIYIIFSTLSKFIWYFVWKQIRKKFKILKTFSACILLAVCGSLIDIFFLFGNLSFELGLILYIVSWSIVLGSMYAFPLFSIPITASLVHDAANQNSGSSLDIEMSKISGSYYGISNFSNTLGPAFASLFIGAILSGSNETNPFVITISFLSLGVFYLIAFLFIKRIKLSNKSYYFARNQ